MSDEEIAKRELSGLKVLLAHIDDEILSALKTALTELGNEIIDVCKTGACIVAKATKLNPDLIVTGVDMPDFDGVTALVEASHSVTIPSIVVTPKRSLELVERALKDHVMAYLVEPIEVEEIKPTVYLVLRRFEQFEELKNEVEDLKETLEQRKLIERAKGVLMRRGDVTEEEAFTRLRRMATDQRAKLVEAARQVLAVDDAIED